MFDKEIYIARRKALLEQLRAQGATGIAVFLGNEDAAMNYRGNTYEFRQDSNFLYFWGLDQAGLAASINIENGRECIYGNDVDIDDIIWMGPQVSMDEKAESVGVERSAPLKDFTTAVQFALQNDVPVHFLPSGRNFNRLKMAEITGTPAAEVYKTAPYDDEDYVHSSLELTKAVIALRLVKQDCEIAEIDKACDLGTQMFDISRQMCCPGISEQEIAGAMEGFSRCFGWGVSFPIILTQDGQILHGHSHALKITPGRLLVVDAGIALPSQYVSDHTRTLPCAGKFTQKQREIYDIVAECNELAFSLTKPGVEYRDVHIQTCRRMLEMLRDLGLVQGDVDEMSHEGIAGLFMPHGLGHNMGLDVHDMEDLGENYVGYDEGQTRSEQLGLGSLRMARRLVPGHVITDEPGIYFIPALWDHFKKNNLDKGFVNFSKLSEYTDFGGIRLEDDILVTPTGARRLGTRRSPILSSDVEDAIRKLRESLA